ncbi:MAG: GTPase ObgE [Elusimicrobia bacterium]|nr:GTPase ObgE [Elusimicrobiota bacterium]
MNFIDKVRVFLSAGEGGDGCLSFHREKFIEFGGPDGADGGKGGHIYLEASPHLTTLLELSLRPHIKGNDGENGKGNNKVGRDGGDIVIPVPMGTSVYHEGRLLVDMSRPGQRYLAAQGGRGGRGNLSFKSRLNTAPRICEKGAPGDSLTLELELKLLADVGLVGFPNAGKSSLLARLSHARPKIAEYPFTTISPNLGVAAHKGVSFVIADIPGLIEGAHRGKGLGADFLRHVERTRVLVHLIDPAGFADKNPVDGVKVIEAELKSFNPRLAQKPRILAVNKMDLPLAHEALRKVRARYRAREIFPISAATGEGLSELLDRVILELSRHPVPWQEPNAPPERFVKVEQGFRVQRIGAGLFELKGPFVERAAAMLKADLPEAVERFQKSLKRIGVDKALRQAGIGEGDMVRCGALEFEWTDKPYRSLPRLRHHRRTRIGVGRPK